MASRFVVENGLVVASGLAPRWAAQQPQQATPVTPDTPSKQVLGRLRHPTGDKPPLHNKSPLHISRASHPTVASGLAPRWAAQQPQQTHPSFARHTAQAGFRAASPPNGGQAPSPQQAPSPHFPPQPPYCGERACPALGCAAAPTSHPSYPRHTAQAGFRAASPPNGGQAPSPQQVPSPHFPPQPPYCGERACPALGCAAAPTNPPQLTQAHRASRF